MEPFKASLLPYDYSIDRELFRLVSEASERYAEYRTMLKTLPFDQSIFLNSVILTESYKSTQIEGTQISQEEMYYLKYIPQTDDNREIQNLKKTIEYAKKQLKQGQLIEFNFVNEMHRILLDSVRGSEKTPGMIRTTQNWIGPRGIDISGATFIPPAPEEVYGLLQNLYQYMNNSFIDPYLVNLGLAHAQFETIHAYKDGNGRLGRALIPIHMAILDESEPILFMSEVLELYKPSYQKNLMDLRRGNIQGYLKFFLQSVIDQCAYYVYRIEKIKEVYKEDMETIKSIKGNSVYRIMPEILKQVVFTKKDIQEESGVSKNVASKVVNQLVDLGILVPDTSIIKKGYRYQRIYEIFVNNGI